MPSAASAAAASTVGPTSEVSALSFEDALAELERIVRGLEAGQQKLEDAITAYERGAALKRQCEARLKAAQMRVEKILVGPSGEAVRSEPADFG